MLYLWKEKTVFTLIVNKKRRTIKPRSKSNGNVWLRKMSEPPFPEESMSTKVIRSLELSIEASVISVTRSSIFQWRREKKSSRSGWKTEEKPPKNIWFRGGLFLFYLLFTTYYLLSSFQVPFVPDEQDRTGHEY